MPPRPHGPNFYKFAHVVLVIFYYSAKPREVPKKLLTLIITVPLRGKARLIVCKPRYVKKLVLIISCVFVGKLLSAQKVDSIVFHLYTDSLKKGTHNYINVDGKLSNGSWQPMTAKEVKFGSSACEFSGNELVIPPNFSGDKILSLTHI